MRTVQAHKPIVCYICNECHEVHDFDMDQEQSYRCVFDGCLGTLVHVGDGETRQMWYNAYITHRAYGGPEEGGWFYTAGQCVGSLPVYATFSYETLAFEVRGGVTLGDFEDMVSRGVYEEHDLLFKLEHGRGDHFPRKRPHYE